MYRALYRKWRPQTFDDVVGQEQVTDILKYQVAENRISHAYLFCGSRGTGKTSCAKILAKAVTCLSPVNGNPCNECAACRSIDAGTATDVIEMDAASNNGVDNVRDMKDEIVFTPAELKYRVYIIDEVHMMSGSAFNALLKTLEEPPSYVLFILATTELHKLPTTIISRCQRYDFRRLTNDAIIDRLMTISQAEGIRLEEGAARLIAGLAQGGMRDAISLLELCAGMNEPIDTALASRVLGVVGRETQYRMVDAIMNQDHAEIFALIADVVRSSQDLSVFWSELIAYYRDLVVVKTLGDSRDYLDITENEQKRLSDLAVRIPMGRLLYHSRLLEETGESLKRNGVSKRSTVELALIRMCEPRLSTTPESLLARIEELEGQVGRMAAGAPIPRKEPAPREEVKNAEPPSAAPQKNTESEPPAGSRPPEEKTKTEAGKRIAAWGAVLEEFAELKPSLRPFLKGSSAMIDASGVVTVLLSVNIFLRMLSGDESAGIMLVNLLNKRGENAKSIRYITAPSSAPQAQLEF